jgi:serine/threonine protein kinase
VIEARLRGVMAEIASRPQSQWAGLLARKFPTDPVMVQQALLWLHADHDAGDADNKPLLGDGDERYDLQVMLDRGATSCVWQAYDRKLGRTVAIKLLQSHGIDQVLTEARAACDVISDHVVRILDVHDGDPPYLVMELVGEHDPDRGEIALGTAASDSAPRDVAEVATWLLRIARGVHDAHLRNVFHRDLKPRNVLITPISRKARIADFGLAVSAPSDQPSQTATPLIRSGPNGPLSVQGTPEYMAPEQARGLPLDLDPRTMADRAILVALDVWGLGALAYSLLSGAGPWGPRGSGIAAWERATSGEAPAPLERTSWGERIPKRLRRIIERAMAIDPHERYPTAAHVANELEAFLAVRPTSFERTRHARSWLWARRNPQLTLTAAVAVVLVALVLTTQHTVAKLRHERAGLRDEVSEQQTELGRLNHNVDTSRHELSRTRNELQDAAAELDSLQHSVADERRLQDTVLQAKEQDLREANAATRQLVESLQGAKAARREAEIQRDRYEASWKSAQREAQAARKERDSARKERDALREALDRLQRELERLNKGEVPPS